MTLRQVHFSRLMLFVPGECILAQNVAGCRSRRNNRLRRAGHESGRSRDELAIVGHYQLQASGFPAIAFMRLGVGRRSLFHVWRFFMARVSPPSLFILRKLAHLGAFVRALFMFAMAVAQGCLRALQQRHGWTSENCGGTG